MAGAVVENLSNRKLFGLFVCLAVVLVLCFLAGGIIAPAPTNSMHYIATKCWHYPHRVYGKNAASGGSSDHLEPHGINKQWFYPRPFENANCHQLDEDRSPQGMSSYDAPAIDDVAKVGDMVWVFQMPGPRDGVELAYSPLFQWLLGMIVPDVSVEKGWTLGPDPRLMLDVRIGYRAEADPPDAWKELLDTRVARKLECRRDQDHPYNNASSIYHCDPIELFELGTSHYPHLLVNIRMPIEPGQNYNLQIGRWHDLNAIVIHQNGGFTVIWLALKTIATPVVIAGLFWFWRRVKLLPRQPSLLEHSLFKLGIAMSFLNLPVDWLSLWIKMPFLLIYSDIRQGIFYAVLASFWLVFTGEHLMDNTANNNFSNYWKRLGCVFCASVFMLIYDLCERGVHLKNPCYSIWSTTLGSNLAMGIIVLAGICGVVYFAYLLYLVVKVLLTIKERRSSLQHMNRYKKLTYEGIIYRFNFLMCFTVVCAALTVAGFIMNEANESKLHSVDYEGAPSLQYTSAFHTGVYGMWNIYVCLLLALYAPSHKRYPHGEDDKDDMLPKLIGEEAEEMGAMPTESSQMSVLTKPSTD